MSAEEGGGFKIAFGLIQCCFAILILRIHIRICGEKKFNDFLVD